MPSSPSPKRDRAKPLSPEERRADIVAAVIPLLREHGADVTTRQIAEAAEVAEGTLFRVFDDKDEIISTALGTALDPTETTRRIHDIDPELPLHDRVTTAATILLDSMKSTIELITVVGPHVFRYPGVKTVHDRHGSGFPQLDSIFEPSAEDLRVEPAQAGQLLEMLTMSNAYPQLNRASPLPPETIASLVLDGVRFHAGEDR